MTSVAENRFLKFARQNSNVSQRLFSVVKHYNSIKPAHERFCKTVENILQATILHGVNCLIFFVAIPNRSRSETQHLIISIFV